MRSQSPMIGATSDMNKNRILALCLLVCLALSGCGADKDEKAAQPIQITWYLRTDYLDLCNSLEGVKKIEEATGVDVIFQCPPDNSEDAYKMMVASGRLPDVIMWSHTNSAQRLFAEGVAIDLTDLIAQQAPNLSKIYTDRPELRREVESADGRLYYFPSINPMLTKEEIGRKSYNGMIIRSDWLEKLGMKAPNTIDEWYEVLSAFKKRDPNGNGIEDEIPFDGWGLPQFAPAFGVLRGMCVKRDGSVAFGPMEQEYKAYLETMAKWYAEGLIGSNALVPSDKWKDENIIGNLTGSFFGLDNAWRYYLPSLQEREPSAELQAMPWFMDEFGTRYTPRTEMAGHVHSIITFITPQCKNPEAAVRFIDYMYSEEGGSLMHWGIEGVTWEWSADGHKALTDYALSICEENYLNLYKYAIGHMSFPKYDGETVVLASYPEDQLIAEWTWADASTALIYPPYITLSAEDQKICEQIFSDVDTYMSDMEMRFITGVEPLSNFDGFVNSMKRMGIDKAVEIYRQYYREMMNRT